MARNWFTFDISPSSKYGCAGADRLVPFRAEIEEWLVVNRRKSVKLSVVSWEEYSQEIAEPLAKQSNQIRQIFQNALRDTRNKDEYAHASHLRVKLRSVRDATLFKMWFSDFVCDGVELNPGGYNSVVLPIIHRAMTAVIAHDIIGVQPMTGPVAQIYNLNVKYGV
jgi:hypothetical protein